MNEEKQASGGWFAGITGKWFSNKQKGNLQKIKQLTKIMQTMQQLSAAEQNMQSLEKKYSNRKQQIRSNTALKDHARMAAYLTKKINKIITLLTKNKELSNLPELKQDITEYTNILLKKQEKLSSLINQQVSKNINQQADKIDKRLDINSQKITKGINQLSTEQDDDYEEEDEEEKVNAVIREVLQDSSQTANFNHFAETIKQKPSFANISLEQTRKIYDFFQESIMYPEDAEIENQYLSQAIAPNITAAELLNIIEFAENSEIDNVKNLDEFNEIKDLYEIYENQSTEEAKFIETVRAKMGQAASSKISNQKIKQLYNFYQQNDSNQHFLLDNIVAEDNNNTDDNYQVSVNDLLNMMDFAKQENILSINSQTEFEVLKDGYFQEQADLRTNSKPKAPSTSKVRIPTHINKSLKQYSSQIDKIEQKLHKTIDKYEKALDKEPSHKAYKEYINAIALLQAKIIQLDNADLLDNIYALPEEDKIESANTKFLEIQKDHDHLINTISEKSAMLQQEYNQIIQENLEQEQESFMNYHNEINEQLSDITANVDNIANKWKDVSQSYTQDDSVSDNYLQPSNNQLPSLNFKQSQKGSKIIAEHTNLAEQQTTLELENVDEKKSQSIINIKTKDEIKKSKLYKILKVKENDNMLKDSLNNITFSGNKDNLHINRNHENAFLITRTQKSEQMMGLNNNITNLKCTFNNDKNHTIANADILISMHMMKKTVNMKKEKNKNKTISVSKCSDPQHILNMTVIARSEGFQIKLNPNINLPQDIQQRFNQLNSTPTEELLRLKQSSQNVDTFVNQAIDTFAPVPKDPNFRVSV